MMRPSLHKGLLILMMLALAMAPMRAGWAMPADPTPSTADHCAQMQHDSQTAKPGDGQHAQQADSVPGHFCNGGCGNDCNASNCTTCAHGAYAAPGSIIATRDIPALPSHTSLEESYPEGTITPPLSRMMATHGLTIGESVRWRRADLVAGMGRVRYRPG